MDSRYLQSLVEVIDRGSIADAARAQNLTAAAISQRIQVLERDLGFLLLSRTGHTAKATQACDAILPRVRRIIREVDLIKADSDPTGLTGSFKLGVISTVLAGLMPDVLRVFAAEAPRTCLRVIPGTSEVLYRALLKGEIQAAIIVAPDFTVPAGLRMFNLRSESLVLLSKSKPRKSVLQTLQEQAYIRYDSQSWGGRFAASYLSYHGLEIAPIFDLDALETITMLVNEDLGISLIPEYLGLQQLAKASVITPIRGKQFCRQIVFATFEPSETPQIMHMMVRVIRALVAKTQ